MDIRLSYERRLEQSASKREALYESLKELILNGGLPSGERLPSSRKLAELYGLSRGTVSQAYDMLYAEGYVRGEQGSGTYVAFRRSDVGGRAQAHEEAHEDAAKEGVDSGSNSLRSTENSEGPSFVMSEWYRRLEAAGTLYPGRTSSYGIEGWTGTERIPVIQTEEAKEPLLGRLGRNASLFASGQTDFRLFPTREWKQSLHAAVRDSLERPMEDGYRELPGVGSLRLREAIASMLLRERGITARPEEIVVTSGSKQGLALILQMLAGPGSAIVLENPCYTGIKEAAAAAGASIIHAEVDEHGIIPGDWDAVLAAVTPNRQFPTGAVLPASRRSELLAWAEKRGALLLEDDYDGEFRYTGRPGEPLKSLDRSGRVIYLGSFSRTMYSGLRIGYIVAPAWLVPRLVRAKTFYEPYASGQLEQLAMARFIQEGRYARHLGRIRREYRRRLAALHHGLESLPGKPFRWRPAHAGLHQYAVWSGSQESYDGLLEQARRLGLAWADGRRYQEVADKAAVLAPGALFGFAHLTEEEIKQGMKQLAEACWS
ncbi:PLP-dependent aminotransferase family protein [Paenibacillus herberti]|uniref:Transcriptional regulator n=1 Tax=Paenibacillus herberti TaxID=1619309 RepID=A0A229P4G6_9BACL|nr:PLP-dependent aminotransferase family protein [Paenibacillus herberti]OXM17142.1 transcriptional regulator [Paenibacillus herberti]